MDQTPTQPQNGNSEENKAKQAFGVLGIYFLKHAPIPAILGGLMWWQGGNKTIVETPEKSVKIEVAEQLRPLRDEVSVLTKDMAEMKGYLRGIQRLANGRSGLSGGAGSSLSQ